MNTSKSSEWLKQHLYVDIDRAEYTEVRNFMLLWNLFEARLFDCDFGKNRARVSDIRLADNLIDETLQYFRDRYTTNNATNLRFKALNLRNNDKPEEIRRILLESTGTVAEKTEAIITIIYRYRNNLFHGEKEIALLSEQQENFALANKFLMACLDKN
ncbi:MAG: hypothetical protein NC250_02400 [Alistipes senegalensis]|nr:hypothetical protein [Bacteroides cellulosilyticus]MCM1351569.1 hypothetical protein [Alistipes senegalensis]